MPKIHCWAGILLALLAFITATPTSLAQQETDQTQIGEAETGLTGPQVRILHAELARGTIEVVSNTTVSLTEANTTLAEILQGIETAFIIDTINNSSLIVQGPGAVQTVIQNGLRFAGAEPARDTCVDVIAMPIDDLYIVTIVVEYFCIDLTRQP
jgi:hypothetical protein